jgi:hypothetical protein
VPGPPLVTGASLWRGPYGFGGYGDGWLHGHRLIPAIFTEVTA